MKSIVQNVIKWLQTIPEEKGELPEIKPEVDKPFSDDTPRQVSPGHWKITRRKNRNKL